MIVRTWFGRASASNPGAYIEHFRGKVLPELRTIAGFLGATLLSEDGPGETEFLVLTRWQSMEAVRAFAGNDVNRAVVDSAAVAALVSFDRVARHYQVVEEVL